MSPIARRQIRAIKVNKERTVILTVFYFTDSLLIWFRFLFLLFSLLSLSLLFYFYFSEHRLVTKVHGRESCCHFKDVLIGDIFL